MDALFFVWALAIVAPGETRGLASSDHFIVSAPSQELADAVLARAETLRDELAETWLGEKLAAGKGRTIINVRVDAARDDAGTLPVSGRSPRSWHIVSMRTSGELASGATLAHEMTHVVLATAYGASLPPWAQEGAAAEQDDEKVVAVRRRILDDFVEKGRWPDLRKILDADSISPSDQTSYTAAASLSEFLLTRGSRATLLAFAVAGSEKGDWHAAVREHYGFLNVADLSREWRAWAKERARPAVAVKPR
ncbi:MAG: hypothetical protein HYS13_14640 [Planctomycetia bacterium]|nr:hypothetical protein [Planctomycetia bacterium]